MRQIPKEALDLIRRFEGLRLKAYNDPSGILTIGYGHTRTAREGMTISRNEAERLLMEDAAYAASIVEKSVNVPLTDGQFAALIDFVFNVGAGAKGIKSGFVMLKDGSPSTLLKELNSCNYDAVPEQLLKWTRAGGAVLQGLVKRRKAEIELWNDAKA